MTSSRINIKVLAGLIAASGHGLDVYYQTEPPEVLAENLMRTAGDREADLILVPDEDHPTALAPGPPLGLGYPVLRLSLRLARHDFGARRHV